MKKVIRVAIVTLLCAGVMVGYYFYLNNTMGERQQSAQAKSTASEKQRLLDADFSKHYPPTPRETMKWYNRIVKLLLSGQELNDDEVRNLAEHARALMDDSLAEQNPLDAYVKSLKGQMEDYRLRKAKIVDTSISDTSDVIYLTDKKGDDLAYVQTSYFVKEASSYSKTYQKYVLREDENGHYKILAFTLTDEDGTPVTSAMK
ncbi:hypothetical protein SAMN05216391_1036 [Lachnospiraceae bacterium KHCPX20]|jgi:uncharacterized protein YxeA|nr:hypothetical protein SAMN05216391_1036 [Lachnospiraceae bacterium KHCPX20]